MTTSAQERHIIILAPHAERIRRPDFRPIAPRLVTIQGARIGFVDNGFTAIAIIHDELRRSLAAYGIQSLIERKRYWRPLDVAQLNELATGADAVIGGLCNTPPSTAWGINDAVELEKRGRPTVTLATSYYEDLLDASVLGEGMPDLRRIIVPFPLEGRSGEIVQEVARRTIGLVIAALTDPISPTVTRVSWAVDR